MLYSTKEIAQTFDLAREDLALSSTSSTTDVQYSTLGTLSKTTSGSISKYFKSL